MEVTPHRCWVEVSLPQIVDNFRRVRSAVGPDIEITAVVKADAYGHGMPEVARALSSAGACSFAVSCAAEGVALREAGIAGRILVMADSMDRSRASAIHSNLTPVVHTLEDLAEFNQLAVSRKARVPYHLKIDTGMGRLGTNATPGEIAGAIRSASGMELEGLMTHFASAADYASGQTEDQIREFEKLRSCLAQAGIRPRYAHASSTSPIAYGRREAWYNMVRPGHALYGYLSPARGEAPSKILTVKPALSWKTRVLALKDLPEGALVGYGGMFRTVRPTRIAILGAGYADGLSHRLSNRGKVIVKGRIVPIVGAVSMDVTTIDVTDCPGVKPGDTVTLLGAEGAATLDAQQIARMAGTISYDILCRISARVKRIYIA